VDQSPGKGIGGQEIATVIFDSECPKVVDRFRSSRNIISLQIFSLSGSGGFQPTPNMGVETPVIWFTNL